jgi:ABC-type multidrug transport system ATPase subunit
MDIPAIEARDLRKTRCPGAGAGGGALDGFSLTVPRGVCLGLVGPGGAGQSTFAAIASGQMRADSGHIRIFGEAPAPEQAAFLPHASEPHRLIEFLTRAAAGDTAASPSGARRLAHALGFIRVPAAPPGLLILDEVAPLDHAALAEALRLIRLLTARGVTLLICSRVATPIVRLCPSAAVVRAGKVVALGASAELLGAPGFRLTVADLSDDLQEALARDGLTVGYNSGGYWIESGDRRHLDSAIDRIRMAGSSIETLEELPVSGVTCDKIFDLTQRHGAVEGSGRGLDGPLPPRGSGRGGGII